MNSFSARTQFSDVFCGMATPIMEPLAKPTVSAAPDPPPGSWRPPMQNASTRTVAKPMPNTAHTIRDTDCVRWFGLSMASGFISASDFMV